MAFTELKRMAHTGEIGMAHLLLAKGSRASPVKATSRLSVMRHLACDVVEEEVPQRSWRRLPFHVESSFVDKMASITLPVM